MSHRPDPDQPTSHYPVLLDLTGRPVVVVGGGEVAEHKVAGLLAAGARVTVVAPRLTSILTAWFEEGRIRRLPRRYRPGDLAGAFLAIVATDSHDVTRSVWEEAQRREIPLNAADDPPHCSFILPAVHRDGQLTIAVATGGKAPALAVRLRDGIGRTLGGGYAAYLDLVGSYRADIASRFPTFAARREVWYRIVDSDALGLVRAGDLAAARAVVAGIIDRAAGRGEGAA